MTFRKPKMISAIMSLFVATSVLGFILFIEQKPPHAQAGEAPAQSSKSVDYFETLTEITTTTTSTTVPTTTTTVPQTTVPAPAPIATGNCDLVFGYDWPQNIALQVCLFESGGNPNAVNMNDDHGKCRGSYGLMQTACFWFPFYGYEITLDPNVNMQVAYNIWQRQGGFGAWTTCKKVAGCI
jgi:hypothetical protein